MKSARIILLLLLLFPLSLANAEVSTFHVDYDRALQLLKDKNYGNFGDLTATLIQGREDEGFSNLVPLSEHLIESGRNACASEDPNCGFFIRTALLLSPSDPWTYFSAATIAPSYREFASHFYSALKFSTNSPTFFFKSGIVFGICFLALASLYIALKLLFGVVRLELHRLSPKGIVTFATLSLLGLPFGLIPAALCWSALLLIFVGRKREVFQLLVLTLAWISFLPTAENMVKFVSRPEEREFELLLSKVSSPSSKLNSPNYLTEPLYLGTKFFREGNFESAKQMFALGKSAGGDSSLVSASRLAAAELGLKQYHEAKENIAFTRAQGLNSYESVHNEAVLAAATLNMNESRILLDKLKEIDKNRLAKASLTTRILLEPLSINEFADRYLQPLEKYLQVSPAPVQWISSEKMLLPLCTLGLIGLLALTSVMAGLLLIPADKLKRFV